MTTGGTTGGPLIRLRGVFKVYGSGDSEVRALDGVDLTIERGEFVAVMGPSGSGKSTCMNVLGCLDRPTEGAYYFRGVNLAGTTLDKLALIRRHYLGFVFQGFNLLARTTALENVELPLVPGPPGLGAAKAGHQSVGRRRLAGSRTAHAGGTIGRAATTSGYRKGDGDRPFAPPRR